MSIFQAGELNISRTGQRQEEEEFLEEEHKRNVELQNLFENAFKEELGDEASSNSTDWSYSNESEIEHADVPTSEQINFVSGNIYENPNMLPLNNVDEYIEPRRDRPQIIKNDKDVEEYIETDYRSLKELNVLYEIRMREIERLNKELIAERAGKEQILNKLIITEREKAAILVTLNQSKTKLAEKEKEVSSLQAELALLQNEIVKIEKSREETKSELEITKLRIIQLEQNLVMSERCDARGNRNKQIDEIIDSLNTKHKMEVNSLQSELENVYTKIKEKEESYKLLEEKLDMVQQKYVNNLLKNCDVTVRQEATVKTLLDEANAEKIELVRKYNNLQNDYKQLQEDLEQYESVRSFNLLDTSSDDKDTDSVIMMGMSRKSDGKNKSVSLSQKDTISKLKDELHRALLGQKSKRQLIKKLQQQIQTMEIQLSAKREQEKVQFLQTDLKRDKGMAKEKLTNSDTFVPDHKHLEEILTLKEELLKKEEELLACEDKIKNLDDQVSLLHKKLLENDSLKEQQENEYLRFHDQEVAKIKAEMEKILFEKQKAWNDRMEELLTESNGVKQLYLDIRKQKEKLAELLHEEKILSARHLNEKQEVEKHVDELKEDIKHLEDYILKLNEHGMKLEEHFKTDNSSVDSSLFNFFKQEIKKLKCHPDKVGSPSLFTSADLNEDDVELFKRKYKEMESRLQTSFEATVMEIKANNLRLSQALSEKEEVILKLQNSRPTPTMKSVSTEMDQELTDFINTKSLEEIDRLEKEVDRLKLLESEKNNEILNIKASFQKKLEDELFELEATLSSQHAKNLAEMEERVKKLSLSYFTDEMNKLRNAHKDELLAIRKEETDRFEELKKTLSNKDDEVKQTLELKKQIIYLQNVLQESRIHASLMMTRWAKEVNEIKEKSEANAQEAEELKLKLKSARKAALAYKKKWEDCKVKFPGKYENLVCQLKEKFQAAITSKEEEIMQKLCEIEEEYKNREEALLRKQVVKTR